MKALIVGLLSLTVLAGCATTPDIKVAKIKLPPAAMGFCKANDGIFVILLGTDGKATGFACPSRKNNNNKQITITQPEDLDPKFTEKITIDLGELEKHFIPGGDPCYDWVFRGTRYYVCW